MWQFLGLLLLFAAVVVAIKAAILLLLLAGLIFRTRQTVGLIAVLGALALVRNYTVACILVGVALVGVALVGVGTYRHRRPT